MPTITEEFVLDLLTSISVSVIKRRYIQVSPDFEPEQIGLQTRTAYMNRASDRETLHSILPEAHYNAIIAMWGPEPTIPDEEIESEDAS